MSVSRFKHVRIQCQKHFLHVKQRTQVFITTQSSRSDDSVFLEIIPLCPPCNLEVVFFSFLHNSVIVFYLEV